jgi:LmbE family N-acetylglucosaminyl deacetylase
VTSPKGRVLVVVAHPDDPEFLAGGTIGRLAGEGREIAYVIVTNGNKGSSDRGITSAQVIPIREAEQRRAARVLGVASVEFLGYEDGELEDTRDLRRDVTREIRRWRPDLVITLNPHRTYGNFPGWHRDHRTTARVVLDCVYPLARDHLSFPELLPDHEPHKVSEVYTVQWEQPRLVVDVTDTRRQGRRGTHAQSSGLPGPGAGVRLRRRLRSHRRSRMTLPEPPSHWHGSCHTRTRRHARRRLDGSH